MENDVTVRHLGRALDAALMRQTAIARNISFADTPNYKEIKVNFEEQLDSVIDSTDCLPFYYEAANKPSLDSQIALGVKNATHFHALIKGLNHKLSIMKLALQGNNS